MEPKDDAGELDAGLMADAGPPMMDAGEDATVVVTPDARVDAFVPPRRDAGTDAWVAPLDRAAAAAFYAGVCGGLAHGKCVDAYSCGCRNVGTPPGDVDSCIAGERASCEVSMGGLDRFYGLDGPYTIDDALVTACQDTMTASYTQCLPQPDSTRVWACLHMMSSSVAAGELCRNGGTLCAGGTGICDFTGRCRPIPTEDGAPCTDACGGNLSCVSGTCHAPLEVGGACSDDEDCGAPHRCLARRCGPLGGRGTACTASDACAVGLECVGSVCRDRAEATCLLGSGDCGHDASCSSSDDRRCFTRRLEGEECESGDECGLAFYCDFSTSWPGRCATAPGRDEPCERTFTCQAGMFCSFFPDRGGYFCAEPAGFGEDCGSRPCAEGLACSDDGRCGAPPGLDEPCPGGVCAPDLTCDWSTFPALCRIPASEGEECGSRRCFEGLRCHWDDAEGRSRCQILPGIGEPCDPFTGMTECRDLGMCSFLPEAGMYICLPPSGPGELCFGGCFDPSTFCGVDLVHGYCAPSVCESLGRFDGGPRPFPRPVPF